ncbi:MAG: alpha/beta fold hydrolase [Phycisphaerae bacterium]|jgi:carboxylesterase|nr:alpha/beta fold hydrolase [Phycisphaerae bacterium]
MSSQLQDDMSSVRPPRRKRIRKFIYRILKIVIVTLAVMQLFNIGMYFRATAEGRKIADTEYGDAFESVDYCGRGDVGVLLFHGLHGVPRNFQAIMTGLQERGIHYYAPMLGGDRPSPLAGLGFTDARFAMDADRAYAILKQRCKRIIVVGHSFGALQATDIASRHRIVAMVVTSPAYRITQRWFVQPSMEAWTRTLAPVLPLLPKFSPARMNDPSGLDGYTGFATFPLQSVNALVDYSGRVLARANQVKAPVLCLLSRGDEVIDVPSAVAGINSLGSAEKRVVWYTRSNHLVLLDYDREDANRKVLGFITDHLHNAAESSPDTR